MTTQQVTTTQLNFFVGDGPSLQFQLIEIVDDGSGNLVELTPDVTGWTAVVVMVPRQSLVPRIVQSLGIIDAGSATFGLQIQGGILPGEAPPLTEPVPSFSQQAIYDGYIVCRTVNPDSSPGEVLTSQPFVIAVGPRP